MQSSHVTRARTPRSLPWLSLVVGIFGMMLLPVVIALTILEPSNAYPEPWHTITHASALFLPIGVMCGVVALLVGIRALQRQQAPQWAAVVGMVTGSLTLFFTLFPSIGVVITLVSQHG